MYTAHPIRRFARSIVSGLTLVAILSVAGLSTADASPSSPSDPHTIVSSDGQLIPTAGGKMLTTNAGEGESLTAEPFTGTGPTEAMPMTASPELTLLEERDAPTSLEKRDMPSSQEATADELLQPNTLYVDSRYRIASPASYPNSAVALITMSNGGSSYRCSGFLIGQDTVVTAGHCVYFYGQWVSNVRVYPGYTGTYAPYGSCSARQLYSVLGWTRDGNSEYDYGVVKLNCAIGNQTGWLGYRWTSASLNSLFTRTAGYPTDKGYEQWGSNGYVTSSGVRSLWYSNFTTSGFNGAPVFDSGLYAVAIHTHASYSGASRGTRITSEVFSNLQYWSSL